MNLLLSLLSLGLFFSSTVSVNQAKPSQGSHEIIENRETNANIKTEKGIIEVDDGKFDEEIMEGLDFIDDDSDDFDKVNVNSVTHFHKNRGEVLVPCFGMWWPVGGSYYYDSGDDYGDYRRKRKSRRRKKAARMKKKKS